MSKHDDLYNKPRPYITDFEFDANVASVFDDMITRSVPGYRSLISMLGVFAHRYYQDDTVCYDLGSSLGAGTLSIATALKEKSPPVIAVDNARAMIDQSARRIDELDLKNIELVCSDIQDVEINNASVVLMNFTLQFIEQNARDALIKTIYQGLVPGGVLVLSEKIQEPDEKSLLSDLHLEFKRANGYSQLEISQKRSALENVLIPETAEVHRQRLRSAGFSECEQWFQSFNFVSFCAVK
jgi:tRNA (cmo5U34)-methyltransferase